MNTNYVTFASGTRCRVPEEMHMSVQRSLHGRERRAAGALPRRAVVLAGAMSRLDFARALGGLANERGTDLLRVKGLVEFSDRPGRPAVVQGAQHAIFPPEWLDA